MPKKKVLVITGTRAEYGLLKPVINEIRASKKLGLRLLVTGMHTLRKYGLTINEIKKDKIPIACVVKVSENDDMLTALNKEIAGIKKYCEKNRPDLILVLGDRDESFASAIVGTHLKIPIAHIRGGEVTGYVVDEYIRHAITKFSHLHFTTTPKAHKRVIALGEEPWRVFKVGATEFDDYSKIKFLDKKTIAKKFDLGSNKKWFLVIHHSAPLDNTPFLQQIRPLLKTLSQYSNIEKIIIYPNSDTGSNIFIKEINKYKNDKDFHIFKNLFREDYINLLNASDLLIGNSSSGIVESTYFKKPTINIGNRQKGRERGNNIIDCHYNSDVIAKTIKKAMSKSFIKKCKRAKSPYMMGNASKKILTIIEKYVNNNKKLFYKEIAYD